MALWISFDWHISSNLMFSYVQATSSAKGSNTKNKREIVLRYRLYVMHSESFFQDGKSSLHQSFIRTPPNCTLPTVWSLKQKRHDFLAIYDKTPQIENRPSKYKIMSTDSRQKLYRKAKESSCKIITCPQQYLLRQIKSIVKYLILILEVQARTYQAQLKWARFTSHACNIIR